MTWHQRPVSRSVKGVLCIPVATVVLFIAPAAKTETETVSANRPNPDNVLVLRQSTGTNFSRWVGPPQAAAATRTVRTQKVRATKWKKKSDPVTAPATPAAAPQATQPGWPNAAATVGAVAPVPLEVKTVREMVTPDPQTSIVFENELSDIDLKARPMQLAAPPALPSTDGRSHAESDEARLSEQPIYAMAETVRTISQSAWFEPFLLALAGALAAVSAVRLFA